MPKGIPSSTKVFDSYFVNKIKNLCIDKVYEKCCPVIHTYNNGKKNLMLMHSPKILRVSHGISFCFFAIIQDHDNNNIRFHLWDIRQIYVEIALNFNPSFNIRLLSKFILPQSTLFDSIVKVIGLLNDKLEVDNHQFTIYHPHYKEKPEMIESIHDLFFLRPLPKLLSPSDVSSDHCNWGNLSATFFPAHNGCVCIIKADMVNGFDLEFVIK